MIVITYRNKTPPGFPNKTQRLNTHLDQGRVSGSRIEAAPSHLRTPASQGVSSPSVQTLWLVEYSRNAALAHSTARRPLHTFWPIAQCRHH